LDKLKKLSWLNISGNQLTSVKELEKLSELYVLDLAGNQLTNTAGLETLDKLYSLDLNKNKLTSLVGLEKLKSIEHLHVGDNPSLKDAGAIKKMKLLKGLCIQNTGISVATLADWEFERRLEILHTGRGTIAYIWPGEKENYYIADGEFRVIADRQYDLSDLLQQDT